jgi:hypothetical protein
MRNAQVQILNAADTASVNGSAFDVNQAVSASFQIVCGDATAAGTVKLQVSNDIVSNGGDRKNFTPTNWSDIPNATSAVSSGVGPAIVIGNMCFSYIRAVYTRTSGGSTTIIVNMNYLSI